MVGASSPRSRGRISAATSPAVQAAQPGEPPGLIARLHCTPERLLSGEGAIAVRCGGREVGLVELGVAGGLLFTQRELLLQQRRSGGPGQLLRRGDFDATASGSTSLARRQRAGWGAGWAVARRLLRQDRRLGCEGKCSERRERRKAFSNQLPIGDGHSLLQSGWRRALCSCCSPKATERTSREVLSYTARGSIPGTPTALLMA